MQEDNPYLSSTSVSETSIPQSPLPFGKGQPSFNLGLCLDTAKKAYTEQLGLAIGVLVLALFLMILLYVIGFALLGGGFALGVAVSFELAVALGGLALLALLGFFLPFQAGLYLLGLYMVRGNLGVQVLFLGFRRYWPVLGGMLLLVLLSLLVQLPSYLVQGLTMFFSVEGGMAPNNVFNTFYMLNILGSLMTLPLTLVGLWLSARFILVPALIIERNMGALDSLRDSWKRTQPFQWWLLLLYLLVGAIALAGLLACGIGVLFSVPFAMAMYGSALQQLLGESKTEQSPGVAQISSVR